MLGDGKTAYDHHNHDNAANENFGRSDVTTKAKLNYIKGKVLRVSAGWGLGGPRGVMTVTTMVRERRRTQ